MDTSVGKKVHCGPVLPLSDDVSDVKVFIFGNLWWPRPKEGPVPECREWALYWSTPAFLRRFGVGMSQRVRQSLEREKHWREQNEKFRGALNQLCAVLLETDFIERAIIDVNPQWWQVRVVLSKWAHRLEVRVALTWNFLDVIDDDFLGKIGFDLKSARLKLEGCTLP